MYTYIQTLLSRITMSLATCLIIIGFLVPSSVFAYPFGGQASEVHNCYNQTIYVVLGAPRGGVFVWTSSTHSYAFGPPTHSGQWLLGLAGVPDVCLYSVDPIDVRAADAIIMHGSSQ